MEIEPNKHYPRQMNGPVISANGMALDSRFEDANAIQDYLYDLSIATAKETELENIGRIIGYPRPIVPEGFNQENLFIFSTLPMTPDELHGFTTIDSEVGGVFSTVVPSETSFMDLELYRSLLRKVAFIKRYGITLYAVDQIAKTITNDYTIGWNENKDILLTFTTSIGYVNVWILSQLFLRLATAPQVIIYSET
jgi:hypothetical protein